MANGNKSRRAKVRKIANRKYEVEFVNNLAEAAAILPPPPAPAAINLTKNTKTGKNSVVPPPPPPPSMPASAATPPPPTRTPLNLAREKATEESRKRATRRAQEISAIENTATPKPRPRRTDFGVEIPMALRNSAAAGVLGSTNTYK